MKTCNTCGGYAHECECAVIDEVVGHTADGYPLNREGHIVIAKCTRAQREAITEALLPRIDFSRRQQA